MTGIELAGGALVLTGFVAGATISEISLREIGPDRKAALLNAFARFRFMHVIAILLVAGLGFLIPNLFWPTLIAYFAATTAFAVVRLRSLDLPMRCRQLQTRAAVAVLLGVSAGGLLSWLS